MLECGEKYAALVPDRISEMESWFGFGWSLYGERKAAADRIHGYVRNAWERLKKVEAPPITLDGLDTYLENYDALPSSTWGSSLPDEQLVEMVQENAEDGACMLERIDERISKFGGEAIPVGKTKRPGSVWDSFVALTIGTGIAVGLGAVVWRGIKSKRARALGEQA